MLSAFFINRPIFAMVISIVIMLVGGLAIPVLPIEQTPDITPPTVVVNATYPGASAQVVAETVAEPLEAEINGVEDMIYMSSKSSDDGTMELTVTFEVGTDVDMATVLVQNRVSKALPLLPEEVTRQGVSVKKKSTNIVLMVALTSPKESYNEIFISNYITTQIKDTLARVPGVGEVQVFGAKDYGMRIWMDPSKMKDRDLTTDEMVRAIREQNVQVAAGQIGAPPAPAGQQFQYTVRTLGRLSDVEQFEDMILKVGDQGQVLRVKDVARVELGAQNYNWNVQLNGKPAIAMGIYQLPGANSLQVAEGINAEMQKLAEKFPADLEYSIPYNTTLFVRASIAEVVETLVIAVILVVFTVYVFLQDLRTTLVPSATIPVALVGTFAAMLALGISINTLSLFGLVLAIGIVVDDAIVVVENTMRLIDEEGLSAPEATKKAMIEVTGPVVATTLVLLAVFVPTAMMSGITGRLYSQFALTISVSTVFSSINALTLSPALCGMLLRPSRTEHGPFFTAFNRIFDVTNAGYIRLVGTMLRKAALALVVYAGFASLIVLGFINIPGGFIPDEDQGYFMVAARLPDGATLERSEEVSQQIRKVIADTPGVQDYLTVNGYSALDALVVPNSVTYFVMLKPWEERAEPELHASAIVANVGKRLSQIRSAICLAFGPPPIAGLGSAGGFELQLQDRGGAGVVMLETSANDLVYAGNADPIVTRLNSNFRATVPQLFLEVDRTKVKRLGVPLASVFSTLQSYLGSAYVNDFNKFNRVYKVQIQADQQFRNRVEDIDALYVRNDRGQMVPLATLLNIANTAGPQAVYHYNRFPSATITGSPTPGHSSGEAVATMERIAKQKLPPSMGIEWSGVTYQQLKAGNQAPVIFALAIVFVYLFLSAQYESWSIPIAVMLSVPLAVLGGIGLTWLRAFDNNVYTQIGLVLLIGLSAKSAILIVEFAKQRHEEGLSVAEAATEAARLRFRAILMTAFSFILGVIPLVIASGAGAASRQALGTVVFGGMLAGTVLGVVFIPVLYLVVQRTSEKLRGLAEEEPKQP